MGTKSLPHTHAWISTAGQIFVGHLSWAWSAEFRQPWTGRSGQAYSMEPGENDQPLLVARLQQRWEWLEQKYKPATLVTCSRVQFPGLFDLGNRPPRLVLEINIGEEDVQVRRQK